MFRLIDICLLLLSTIVLVSLLLQCRSLFDQIWSWYQIVFIFFLLCCQWCLKQANLLLLLNMLFIIFTLNLLDIFGIIIRGPTCILKHPTNNHWREIIIYASDFTLILGLGAGILFYSYFWPCLARWRSVRHIMISWCCCFLRHFFLTLYLFFARFHKFKIKRTTPDLINYLIWLY